MIIEYEIDCWKCNDWHPGIATSQEQLLRITQGGGSWVHAVRILNTERRTIRVRSDRKLWLVPWFGNRGILIGASGAAVQILPWVTARWEFADHDGGTEEWNSAVLRGGRNV